MDPIAKHKAAYEALHAAQEVAQEKALDLEEARAEAVEFLVGQLAKTKGIKSRKAEPKGNGRRGPLLMDIGGSDDPLVEVLKATESRYFGQLGKDKPLPPLAIYHVNNIMEGGAISCPECGHEYSPAHDPAPHGTVGRGARGPDQV